MNPKVIAIIVAVVLFVLVFYHEKTDKAVNDFIMDTITKKKIEELHPAIRSKAIALVNLAEKHGIKLRIYDALRSYEKQQKLFNYPNDGIDNNDNGIIDDPSEKVTNAKPGQSFHNFALAFDTVEMKDGVALWDNPRWNKIGSLGESLGLKWGGNFAGSFKDKPHFEILNFPLSHAQRNYANGKFDSNGYILLT